MGKALPSKLCIIAFSGIIAISRYLIIGTDGFTNTNQLRINSVHVPSAKATYRKSHFGRSSRSRREDRGGSTNIHTVETITIESSSKLPVNQQRQEISLQDRRQFIVSRMTRTIVSIALLGLGGSTNSQAARAVGAGAAQQLTDECSNGSIAAEQTIPGAYENICMSLPQRSITLKSTGDEIRIYQGSVGGRAAILRDRGGNNGSLGTEATPPASTYASALAPVSASASASYNESNVTGRTGVALWNSGLLLARLLDEIAATVTSKQQYQGQQGESGGLFRGKTVLELGCGTGLNSIIASKLGAEYVYATDGNMEVLELAKLNLEQNSILPTRENSNANIGEADALQWGSLDSVDYYDTADVILGSDLTYNSGSWKILADTLSSVLKANGYFLYLTLGHSGFNVSGELNGFLTVVQSAGSLEVVDENSSRWPFPGVGSLELLLNSSLSGTEKNVVKSTGGYKIVVLRKKIRKQLK